LETIETALLASETGHLVLATLHTPDAAQTVHRIYSVFPSHQRNSIALQLASSLQAIIAQKLLPRSDGKGRVLATEICMVTPAIRNIVREQKEHQIYSEMQTGRRHNMQTMDSALLQLYQKGEITYDTMMSHAHDPAFIKSRTGDN
jgi:twitching motility protein PilT